MDSDNTKKHLLALEKQIIMQQGLGKKIVSEVINEQRYVTVGGNLYKNSASRWQSFHDFLFDFLKLKLKQEWIQSEAIKSDEHPFIKWMKISKKNPKNNAINQNLYISNNIPTNYIKANGATIALLDLSYNLYLLEHNAEIQNILLKRLRAKNPYGALYETSVAAILILAGFSLKMENERDSSKSHCEFIAILKDSPNKYAVEAKARTTEKKDISIKNQLFKALKKAIPDDYKRIIFIEMNIPNLVEFIPDITQELKLLEKEQIDNKPAPSAYIIITNHSYIYSLYDTNYQKGGFVYGFKMPDFFNICDPLNIYDDTIDKFIDSKEKHKDIEHLIKYSKNSDVPATFDGEIPLFEFSQKHREERLIIGKKYLVPNEDGKDEVGILEQAIVMESKKIIFCVYRIEDTNKRSICSCPINDDELEAYRNNPETFFGIIQQVHANLEHPLDICDKLYSSYKDSSKEKLMSLMSNTQNNFPTNCSREELLKIFIKGSVLSIFHEKCKFY